MKSFMYNLYFGRISPWECKRPKDPEYTQLMRESNEFKHYFKKLLSPEDWERFEDMIRLDDRCYELEEVSLFEYGLSMGILLMTEVINFKERQFEDE